MMDDVDEVLTLESGISWAHSDSVEPLSSAGSHPSQSRPGLSRVVATNHVWPLGTRRVVRPH